MDEETKLVDLSVRCIFEDRVYGPGQDIEVPLHFPDPEVGDDIPPASPSDRTFASAPSNGGVNTGE